MTKYKIGQKVLLKRAIQNENIGENYWHGGEIAYMPLGQVVEIIDILKDDDIKIRGKNCDNRNEIWHVHHDELSPICLRIKQLKERLK